MGEAAGWVGAALVGAVLGLGYFAGLWWTVQRAKRVRHPEALVAASFVLRAAVAVVVLILIMGDDVWRLLAALGGFLVVRTAVLWRVRRDLRHEPRARA
jgi:F1F0 ATPase subunit 2